jgi:hypothetical protein
MIWSNVLVKLLYIRHHLHRMSYKCCACPASGHFGAKTLSNIRVEFLHPLSLTLLPVMVAVDHLLYMVPIFGRDVPFRNDCGTVELSGPIMSDH